MTKKQLKFDCETDDFECDRPASSKETSSDRERIPRTENLKFNLERSGRTKGGELKKSERLTQLKS